MEDPGKRIYLSRPELVRFEARVTRVEDAGDGRSRVWLDATCFYPESGGQPADGGTLGGLEVMDVIEEDGDVCHVVAGTLEAGTEVEGRIDAERRRDHTVQHTGQHLLSRVLLESFGLRTVGFHLGEKSSTIDLEGPEPSEEALAAAERLVNVEVMKDTPVSTRIVGRSEYEAMAAGGAGKEMRTRLPEGVEEVRVVEIEGVDVSSCCGTHCRSTGEIGIVKITRTEKVRGNTRAEFLCGLRACDDYAAKQEVLYAIASAFSTDWRETAEGVERLMAENKSLRREASALAREVAGLRAADAGEPDFVAGGIGVYVRELEDADAGSVREMVNSMKDEPGRVILFGTGAPSPALVFACSEDAGIDMGSVMKEAAEAMGARGGGRGSFAQGGGGDPALLGKALETAAGLVRKELEG